MGGFRTVCLEQTWVPALRDVTLCNREAECWVRLDLPEIRRFAARGWRGDADAVSKMLADARGRVPTTQPRAAAATPPRRRRETPP